MSPFSRPVLVPSLVLCSPVLWDAYQGVVAWSDALNRFLLVLGVCWVAVSVVHALAFSPPGPAPPVVTPMPSPATARRTSTGPALPGGGPAGIVSTAVTSPDDTVRPGPVTLRPISASEHLTFVDSRSGSFLQTPAWGG